MKAACGAVMIWLTPFESMIKLVSINGLDNVKIKSREILLKKNLPKQNQRTL